ncbi:DNA polymerase delta, subunit 4-domain-containing protein, partial [Vararia minispora EC-137]
REPLDPQDKRWDKAYGVARAKMGHLPPVHAEKQTRVHHILRVFDMSYEYGPCIGVTRLQRWERARALGLNPPQEVHDILVTREGNDNPDYAQSVLYE